MPSSFLRAVTLICLIVLLAAPSLGAQQRPAQDTTLVLAQLLNAGEASLEVNRWYPDRLRELNVSGTVVLRLKVNAEGKITYRDVFASSGVRGFDRAAMRVSEMLKLQPATRAGVAVDSEIKLPIRFEGAAKSGVVQLTEAQLLTRDSAVAVASRSFPKTLRSRNLNGYSSVGLALSSDGLVREATLNQSSCFPEADEVAMRVARHLRFAPAAARTERGLINVTFAFQNDSVRLTVAGDTMPPDTTQTQRSEGPAGSRADLLNRDEVGKELIKRYPSDLLKQALGAEVIVRILVDERGRGVRREVANTSGSCTADLAALEVAKSARFKPALFDGKPVRAWVQLPLIFRTGA
jgi:TonB family protein